MFSAASGGLRRFARRLGIGRALLRMGLGGLVARFIPPEGRARTPAPAPDTRGALLIGHPFGVQAVGEYLRASAGAFAAAGIPFHIRSATNWGEHLRGTHDDFAFFDRMTNANPHRVNVFHLNANEMESARRNLGPTFFAGRYNIACWHWELSRFPAAWRGAFEGVDELWASSRFLQDALAEAATVPVEWMPHPVWVRGGTGLTRRDLGLPDRAYLFLTSFDFNSYVTRKNPLGTVRAFRRAFPAPDDDGPRLVVKASGAAERPDEARAFFASAELSDPRIHVIDAHLDRRRMVGLLEQCDAYVSLHRAEGFGRGLAEAMLLGKPVIATAYSGNMDFTKPDSACLVDYRLVPVGGKEYPHARGQVWADPDIEHAASFMRRLAGDGPWGAALGARGRDLVSSQHGIDAVGRRYRARLEELGFA